MTLNSILCLQQILIFCLLSSTVSELLRMLSSLLWKYCQCKNIKFLYGCKGNEIKILKLFCLIRIKCFVKVKVYLKDGEKKIHLNAIKGRSTSNYFIMQISSFYIFKYFQLLNVYRLYNLQKASIFTKKNS